MDTNGLGRIVINFAETSTGTVGLILKNLTTNVTIPVILTKNVNNYSVSLSLPKGRYEYYFTDSLVVNNNPIKYHFSVGYVFVIVGHSLASGNGTQHATDDRVYIFDGYQAKIDSDWKNTAKYTGGTYKNPDDIYAAALASNQPDLYDSHQVGPWSRMAQLIAQRDDVTVAIINTAMGGSSVEMWADEAAQRPFKHGFASTVSGVEDYNLYNSGIPYFHFENVLKTFGKKTGVTAVLVQHGENDMLKSPATLGAFYKTFIDTARTALGDARLPFVIAKSAWLVNSAPHFTQDVINNTLASVDEALRITDFTHVGVDTHLLPQTLRGQPNNAGDGHWNPAGSIEVGRMWAERLTANFLLTINNGVSTLVKLPEVEPVVTQPVEPGNSQSTLLNAFAKLNWTAATIISLLIGGTIFALRYFKIFRKITNIIIVIGSLIAGVIFLSINYFVNQKRQV
jgi:hypothetical protein